MKLAVQNETVVPCRFFICLSYLILFYSRKDGSLKAKCLHGLCHSG